MHLLGFCERFAVGAEADDVVAEEALGLVELSGLQHPQADIDDYNGVPLMVMVTSARRSRVVMVGAGTTCSLIADVAVADPEDRDTLPFALVHKLCRSLSGCLDLGFV